jgi:hypothetical protein
MNEEFKKIISEWVEVFCTQEGLVETQSYVIGASDYVPTVPFDQLLIAYVLQYAKEVSSHASRHNNLCLAHERVLEYLVEVDVKPNQPDILKYHAALGYDLYEFVKAKTKESGDHQPLMLAMIRVNVIRTMVAGAKVHRQNPVNELTEQLYKKLFKLWRENDKDIGSNLGRFGTYMIIKMMAAG